MCTITISDYFLRPTSSLLFVVPGPDKSSNSLSDTLLTATSVSQMLN